MADDMEQQYDDRDRNEHEPGKVGATSPGVGTDPRGNPPADDEDVRKSEEKLDQIVNW